MRSGKENKRSLATINEMESGAMCADRCQKCFTLFLIDYPRKKLSALYEGCTENFATHPVVQCFNLKVVVFLKILEFSILLPFSERKSINLFILYDFTNLRKWVKCNTFGATLIEMIKR